MRWIRYSHQGRTAYGILEGDRIVEVSGNPFAGYERGSRKLDLAAREDRGAGHPADLLLRRPQLCRAHPRGGGQARHQGQPAGAARRRLSCHQCPDRARRAGRHPARRHQGAVRRRARRRHRQEGQEPERGRGAVVRARLHHRQRRERACLAEVGSHAVARQEQRHLQAHGAVDRHARRPRCARNHHPPQRQGDAALLHQRHDLRRRALYQHHVALPHASSRRHDLDGHGRQLARPRGRATWWRSRSPASAYCATRSSPKPEAEAFPQAIPPRRKRPYASTFRLL